MKKSILILLMLISSIGIYAQRAKKSNQKRTTMDSVQWKKDHYIVNRDSAYVDPRVAIKKLMGGNKRFVEGKSIKPRQDMETIKKGFSLINVW